MDGLFQYFSFSNILFPLPRILLSLELGVPRVENEIALFPTALPNYENRGLFKNSNGAEWHQKEGKQSPELAI
jgi:hypothetical protein